MLYTIRLKYLDKTGNKTEMKEGDLILDLPQMDAQQARRNLFVKDLVRKAEIEHYYRDDPSYQKYPEGILNSYPGFDIPASANPVRILYKRYPEVAGDIQHELAFHIYLDVFGESYIPFSQLEFVCRREFDVYYDAFMLDLLVLGQALRQMKPYHDGDYVKVFSGTDCQIAQAQHDSQGIPIANIIGTGKGNIPINMTTYPFIKPIVFTTELLSILQAELKHGLLHGSKGIWYELYLANPTKTQALTVTITWDCEWYYVVIDNPNHKPDYQLIPFRTLDRLQTIIREKYNFDLVISNLKRLESYISNLHRRIYFLTELTDFVSSLGFSPDYNTVIEDAEKKYNLSEDYLRFYLSGYYERGYFKKLLAV